MVLWLSVRYASGRALRAKSLPLCLLLCILWSGASLGAELSRTTDSVYVVAQGPHQLSRRPIIHNSESVSVEGVLLERDEHYKMNYRLGVISFMQPFRESTLVVVEYLFFPFDIDEKYFHYEPSSSGTVEEEPVGREPMKKVESSSAPSTLIIGGSKSLGVSIGSDRDVALEQALRVNISGMATEDVEVRAVLSDQSTPIQPEGTTEELEELDQVLLEIKGRNLSASFGDYDLSMSRSDFGQIDRKLEGGMGEAAFAGTGLMLAAARNRGNFTSMRFWGVDGKQGPYQLRAAEGGEEIVVVAGSERVYVDGQIRRRGENNDYAIDYSAGQITFTSRVLMTSRSRVLVDFEYAVLDYKRSLYGGSGFQSLLSGKMVLGGSYLFEGDDKGSPTSLTITPEREKILRDAGDDTSLAWAPGGVYVGDSLGSYVWQDTVYVYVGYGEGDYSVSFTDVGEGEGDYEFDYGLGGYVYVGENGGRYVARVRLPLPTRDQYYSFSGEYNIVDGTKARVEYAGSDVDGNSYSSLGDDDNTGSAYSASFDSRLGRMLSLKSDYKSWDGRFSFPGRKNDPDYEDTWNIDQGEGEESVGEIEVGLSPLDMVGLSANLGRLVRPTGEATRMGFGASLSWKELPSAIYVFDRAENDIDTTGTRTRHKVTAVKKFGWVTPRVSYFQEESGKRLREGTGGFSFAGRWLTGDLSYAHRFDDAMDSSGWDREATVRTAKASFQASGTERVTGSLDLVHRDKKFNPGYPGESSNYNLASVRLKLKPLARRLSVEARYELTQTELRATREVFYEVEEGTGDYSRDPNTGEYYPDPEGNYRRQILRTGDYRPVTSLSSSFRMSALPVDMLSLDGFLTLEQKGVRDEGFSGYFFDLPGFHNDSSAVSGLISFQGDIDLFAHAPRSLGMRVRYSDQEENQIESIHAERQRFQLSLLGKTRLTGSAGVEAEVTTRNEERKSTERGLERREDWQRLRTTLTYRPNSQLEPSISVAYEEGRVSEPYYYAALGEIPLTAFEFSPRLRYYMRGKGRIETVLTLTERRSDASQFPADLLTIYPTGLTTMVRSSLEYRVNEWLTAYTSHTARREPEDETEHTAKVEMRASF